MAEYFVQEQQLSKVTRTLIKDEQGKTVYLMVGRWGARGDVLSIYALNGELLASIKQVSLTFGSRFELYADFKKVGVMQKILNWNLDFYYVQGLHWAVVGDIKDHHYSIYAMNKKIMQMDRAMLMSGNYYALTIPEEKDAPLCICISAVLDYWLYNRKKNKGRNYFLNWSTD
ncbi:hypothetical protein RU97_GL002004 [Enterococcus canis]|uniref:YxjI n=1 Tax=Enterococcus canis TaxID=214095 RepID=A0A1L8RFU7_9ENTE|nr:hypothetical protein [Enterococcus canis]OJG18607.1 hypothetical protein RU97_GL002004 [Enterococcus canis]